MHQIIQYNGNHLNGYFDYINYCSSVSILWIVYLKFLKKRIITRSEEIKNKEHEIDLIKLQHEKDLNLLKEKFNSLENEKNLIEETLTKKRNYLKNLRH